jgi:23S rRNA pseudouridine2605 synthase
MALNKNSRPAKGRQLKSLERVFSKAGAGSRSEARGWIKSGKVRVNGKIERDPERPVDAARDRITLDGNPLRPARPVYILLHKPEGHITTRNDPEGRPTVYDLVGGAESWLSPVGRLDLDTSGLLLMTNDTAFADHITSPAGKIPKTYRVKTATLLSEEALESLRRGVTLRDGPTRPAVVTRLRDSSRRTFLEITITEGRNRQVRRMIEAVGSKVLELARTAIGPVGIGDLPPGAWRPLTESELRALMEHNS